MKFTVSFMSMKLTSTYQYSAKTCIPVPAFSPASDLTRFASLKDI